MDMAVDVDDNENGILIQSMMIRYLAIEDLTTNNSNVLVLTHSYDLPTGEAASKSNGGQICGDMSAKAIAEEFSHDKKQECAKGREEDRKQHADDCHHNCMRDDAMQIMMMTGMMPCK